MKNRIKILSIALLFIITSCGKDKETYIVDYKPLNEAVYASGKIMPYQYDMIKSISNGKILKFTVAVGDTVKPGQIVAILGPSENQTQIEYLNKQISIVQQQASGESNILQQLQAKIKLAEKQYKQKNKLANKYSALAKDTAVSKKMANNAQLEAQESYIHLQNLKNQLSVKKQQLEAQVYQLKSNLKNIQAQQGANILKSTINGVILNINPKVGENVSPNEPIMLIGSPNKYILELLVDERDITKIKEGQNVLFQTDAYKNTSFKAKIIHINPVLKQRVRSFKIKAKVLSDTLFYPKTSAEANIIVKKENKVLMIPNSYLLNGDSVWLKKGEAKQKISIKTSIKNNNWIVVDGGLQKDDTIIKIVQ